MAAASAGRSWGAIGHRRWTLADGYLPGWSNGPTPELSSHETICILNAAEEDAAVVLWIFFADREPAGPYHVQVPARRTRHIRFDDLREPEPIPRATDFACLLEASVPVVVQHTRLDSRQAENALFSHMAWPG